jgi:hypothetical protein
VRGVLTDDVDPEPNEIRKRTTHHRRDVRPVTRRALAGLALVVVALLALGAVPSALGSGDPYYLVVEPTDGSGEAGEAVNASLLSERRYPYLFDALVASDGRSEAYRRGRFGLKESFAHSPFDEVDALATQNPNATRRGAGRTSDAPPVVLVEYEGRRYAATVTRGG